MGLDDSMGTSYVTMPDGSTDFPVLGDLQREGSCTYPKLKAKFVGTK